MDKETKILEFIKKAKEIHKGENLDYSEVVYVNNRTPVKIIDHDLDENGEEYGEFWQTPSNHLKGQSHPLKRALKIKKKRSHSQEEVIERFKQVHKGENLDYSKVEYKNMHTKVCIIDHDLDENGEEYGEFWQEPVVHLKGCGHPKKGKNKQVKSMYSNTEEFVERGKKIHSDKDYDYSKVSYVNSRTKVKIICNKKDKNNKMHGEFEISPDNFLQGKGCYKCGNHLSYAENEISDMVLNAGISVIRNDRTILNGKELDIFIPSKNIAIEYHGLRWHSEKFKTHKYYHLNKLEECNNIGIKLIQIFEDEYKHNKHLVLTKISHIIGIQKELTKIAGRKCQIQEITIDDAKLFLNQFHIQGFAPSTIYLGSYYNNKLIAVMTFKKENNKSNNWELNRFASDYNYICQGVGGKLFKYFIRNYDPLMVKSFADRRWTIDVDNNIYVQLGFSFEGASRPDYRYTTGSDTRIHKFNFRKQILHKKYGLPLTMTETEMTKALGYYRIWDCGLIKYIWKK